MSLLISIGIFITITSLLLLFRPSFLYKDNTEFKEFGISHDKTLFSFGSFIVIFSIFSVFIGNKISE